MFVLKQVYMQATGVSLQVSRLITIEPVVRMGVRTRYSIEITKERVAVAVGHAVLAKSST